MEAVLGRRILYFGELRKMECAETIVLAYRARAHSLASGEDWKDWAIFNPIANEILKEAETLLNA